MERIPTIAPAYSGTHTVGSGPLRRSGGIPYFGYLAASLLAAKSCGGDRVLLPPSKSAVFAG
jgi:hypothetical protein